mmetsp:Transcript_18742/g.41739  ORF Transcript_18742/g.41739 Transcript_18742/m.41739 type:complete len:206 (+) Transcript_18742:1053-1670(+)
MADSVIVPAGPLCVVCSTAAASSATWACEGVIASIEISSTAEPSAPSASCSPRSTRTTLAATAVGATGSRQKCTVSYSDLSMYTLMPSLSACATQRYSPDSDTVMDCTGESNSSQLRQRPVGRSHTRSVLSRAELSSLRPSGVKARSVISRLWPPKKRLASVRVPMSYTLMTLSWPATATKLASRIPSMRTIGTCRSTQFSSSCE